jgi:hypothetical protein
MKMIPESFYSVQNAKLCLLLPYKITHVGENNFEKKLLFIKKARFL